jgi:hypothetical protein
MDEQDEAKPVRPGGDGSRRAEGGIEIAGLRGLLQLRDHCLNVPASLLLADATKKAEGRKGKQNTDGPLVLSAEGLRLIASRAGRTEGKGPTWSPGPKMPGRVLVSALRQRIVTAS